MAYQKPLPRVNADTKPFWDGSREHKMKFQKCRECGHVRWPASIICPKCYSSATDWIVSSGKGKVYSFVVHHRTFDKAFENDLPYVAALVELEEGPIFLSNIVGLNPKEVKIGLPVEVTWEDVTPELSLPKFKPAT